MKSASRWRVEKPSQAVRGESATGVVLTHAPMQRSLKQQPPMMERSKRRKPDQFVRTGNRAQTSPGPALTEPVPESDRPNGNDLDQKADRPVWSLAPGMSRPLAVMTQRG